jgi:PAS domain S-box-containing protein
MSSDTKAELQESIQPALLSSIIGSAMDAIIALDSEQRIVLFNPGAEQVFRCPALHAIGDKLDRFLPERYRNTHRKFVEQFGITQTTSRSMGHLRPLAAMRADGEEFPIEATISNVEIDGRTYYAAIVRDISGRREAEIALQKQAALLDLAYDAIFTWDWGGAITSWNRGAERLYGYSRDEAIGQISHLLLKTTHPEGVSAVHSSLYEHGVWEGELTHTRKDGSEVVVESRHVIAHDGDDSYVLEANRDATESKRAEEERARVMAQEAAARAEAAAAAAERDRLHEILSRLPSGVYIVQSSDRSLTFANSPFRDLIEMPGTAGDQSPGYGRDFSFLRADGTPLPVNERPGLRAMQGERVYNQQLLLERKDGSLVPITAHAAPLGADIFGSTHAIVVIQDVAQLRQAEQLKDDFLALVSHEFRTPLTAIHGGAHLLSNAGDSLDDETKRELLADVVAESERLDRMLGNMLSLANVMAGRLPVVTEPVLLAPLARRAAEAISNRSPLHAFFVDIPANFPPVEADPDLLDQVIRNLYENAVKYAPAGGPIRTTASHDGESVTITITDTGIGIAPEHVDTVFERFRRVGGDPRVRGMGLGLYLSRHLVEAQGGHIWVTSPGPGLGASFSVTLGIARDWSDDDAPGDESAEGEG